MSKGGDMIVSLFDLPSCEVPQGIKIKRGFAGEKEEILRFIEENFQKSWIGEAEHSLMQEFSKCFIATENGKIVGFACYDASAKGFFGPTGVLKEKRGQKIGRALLLHTLEEMKANGYGYAIIGWVSDAEVFYRKTVGAEWIKGGSPENSVYSNMISM